MNVHNIIEPDTTYMQQVTKATQLLHRLNLLSQHTQNPAIHPSQNVSRPSSLHAPFFQSALTAASSPTCLPISFDPPFAAFAPGDPSTVKTPIYPSTVARLPVLPHV